MSRKRPKRPPSPASASADDSGGPGERLQKVLAAAGVGSRRDCEELIREGRVEVDRQVVTELGTRVDPLRHEIRVDGEALRKPKTLYYAVNKPMGVVTTNDDPDRRTRVVDLVPTEERVFAVGRLDRSSEGLILVTNDGEFANRITHPRYGVEKTYLVRVAGAPGAAELQRLRKGVYLSDGYCRVQSIVPKKRHKGSTDLVIVLNEGRNRELRRILARVGHKVLRLKRIAVGPIKLGDLPTGNWRRLMPGEIAALLAVAKERRREAKKRRGPPPAKVDNSLGESRDSTRGASEPQYNPRQALAAEPLSLDDLLRDDLDEGGLVTGGAESQLVSEGPPAGAELGEVLDYDFDEAPPSSGSATSFAPLAAPPEKFRKKKPHRGRRPAVRGARPGERERSGQRSQREDFGRKRVGKGAAGPHEGRQATGGQATGGRGVGGQASGSKGGGSRFRKKPKVRRGGKRFGDQSGQQGGKGKGRR